MRSPKNVARQCPRCQVDMKSGLTVHKKHIYFWKVLNIRETATQNDTNSSLTPDMVQCNKHSKQNII